MNTNNKSNMSGLTVRGHLRVLLEQDWYTLRELSQEVRVSEKDLLGHLEHLRRSAKAGGAVFEVDAPLCLACGFNFTARNRLQRPGRCPKCRSTRISKGRYRLIV
ncbi:MAG: transcriptional regulator [Desulfobulbaceae bacterium]|nr:transcriptional regulator [Desulfobulbaceae bacterium]